METLLPREWTELGPGAVHVPDWLEPDEQHSLVEDCRRWAEPPAPMRHTPMPNGTRMTVRTVCLGWHWQPYRYLPTADDTDGAPVTPFPEELGRLARRALTTVLARGVDVSPLRAAEDFVADCALVNHYDPTAVMGLHQDKDERSLAPVVSLSIGDACRFRFATPERRGRPYRDVELRSGDLVVFGGASRLAYHGVVKVLPGTGDPAIGPRSGRLNITIRETGLSPRSTPRSARAASD